MITIYTDGSSRGNPGPGGWGAIVSYQYTVESRQQEWVTEIGGRETLTTNNRMELTATIKALEFISKLAPSPKPLEAIIHTDSEYVMKGMTIWIHNWQKKGWRTANRKPVLNQDLWKDLLRVSENKKVEWKYVASHTGVPLNERADEIATSYADNIRPTLYDGPKDKYK